MKNLKLWAGLALIALCAALFPEDGEWEEKVDPALMARLSGGARVECLVVLRDQADLSGAGGLRRKEEKGQYVFDQLQVTARTAQAPLRELLDEAGAPYRAFYIINSFWVSADRLLIERLARRPDVERIEDNPQVFFQPPRYEEENNSLQFRDATGWGILRIGADQVWAMGFRGQGVVIGDADTGVRWTHPALRNRYRGSRSGGGVDHNYNWHDAIHAISPLHRDSVILPTTNPCGLDVRFPCDDDGHGTLTTGVSTSDAWLGNAVGVAPEARWTACRNMERGYGSPATYIECFQWFLAPTDLDNRKPDPSKAPHVINNSWGCPLMEGCNPGNFATMEQVVNTVKQAGIFLSVSAGNDGAKCSTLNAPAAIFPISFTVGATRPSDTIASFSSRGPVLVDGSGRLKPDISAPGVSIPGPVRDSSYTAASGTSLAAPHVTGLVALMISANPALAGQVGLIERIIRETARPMTTRDTCGNLPADAVPNAAYGYGRINALAAVSRALRTTGTGEPGSGASVRLLGNPTAAEALLAIEGLSGPATLELFDAAGRPIRRQALTLTDEGRTTERLNLANLAPGVYVYRLTAGKKVFAGKMVKR